MRDGAALLRGCGIDGQIEAAGELHASQDAQRIFAKRIAGGAQHAIFQIFAAAEEIEKFIRDGIEGHRVDREIAAAGGFLGRDLRIERREEIAMRAADFAVAARDAEIVNAAAGDGQFHDAEALTDQIDAAVMLRATRREHRKTTP